MTQENLSSAPSSLGEPATAAQLDAVEPAPRPSAATRYARGILTALLLAWAAVVAYWPAFDCGFVNYDDNQYVYANENVTKGLFVNDNVRKGLSWERVQWAFTNTETVNWYPLTWLSLQLDATIWGVGRPFGFHLTNIILHIADTLLLFWVLTRATGRLGRSAFVAGLFALHPLHVESVAWVTERKDVLSGLFWMLALAAYVHYTERPRWWNYLLVVLAFAVGLLSKSMLVTLPCVLFLLDYWPLRRYPAQVRRDAAADGPAPGFQPAPASWLRLIAEKIPLFVLAAASTAITMYAQMKGGESNPIEEMRVRIGNALISYVSYISKTIWPVGLVPYYPFPKEVRGGHVSFCEATMAGLLLLAVTILVLAAARRRPYLIVGWLWFLGTLAPVIGVIQVLGDYAMADRFTYIPLIGLFIAATWGAADGLARAGVRPWLSAAAAVLVLGGFAAGTWQQVGYWHDSITLWKHTLDVNPKNHLAYNNIGHELRRQGDEANNRMSDAWRRGLPVSDEDGRLKAENYRLAERYFRQSFECDPSFGLAHYTLAFLLWDEGRGNEAAAEFLAAAAANPENAAYQQGAGHALLFQGKYKDAISHYQAALKIDPQYYAAHLELGWAFFQIGDDDGAARHYQAALESDSKSAEAHDYLGRVRLAQGDLDGAVAEFQAALAIDANYAAAHEFLGTAFMRQGKPMEGAHEMAEAQRLRQPPGQGP